MSSLRRGVSCLCLVPISIILGGIITALFGFGIITLTTAIVPYLAALAFIGLVLAGIFLAICAIMHNGCREEDHINILCKCIEKYACCIIASAVVLLIALLALIITSLLGLIIISVAAIIIVFIASTAFFLLLLSYVSFLCCLLRPSRGGCCRD